MDTKISMAVVSLLFVLLGMAIQILINYLKKRNESVSDPVNRPHNAIDFKSKDSNSPNGYVHKTESGVELSLSNVHPEVQPCILPTSPDEETRLRSLPIDGDHVLGPILANIVFYEKNNPYHLITHFLDEVTLTFTLPVSYRNQLIKDRDESLIRYVDNPQNIGNEEKQAFVKNIQERDIFMPAYLYVSQTEKNIQIWKPFQNYSVVKIKTGELVVTITFKSWGDQNVSIFSPLQAGFGPKK